MHWKRVSAFVVVILFHLVFHYAPAAFGVQEKQTPCDEAVYDVQGDPLQLCRDPSRVCAATPETPRCKCLPPVPCAKAAYPQCAGACAGDHMACLPGGRGACVCHQDSPGLPLPTQTSLDLDRTRVSIFGLRERHTRISSNDCPAVMPKKFKTNKKGITRIRATWPSCGSFDKKVRLAAKIVDDCTLVKGKLKAGAFVQRIKAVRQPGPRSCSRSLPQCNGTCLQGGWCIKGATNLGPDCSCFTPKPQPTVAGTPK